MSDIRSLDLEATNKALHVTQATLLSGEDQTNKVLRVEASYTGILFDRDAVTSDFTLGITGGLGDYLHKVIVLSTISTSGLSIYDGPVANGKFVLFIPVNTPPGTIYSIEQTSTTSAGFVCADTANGALINCIGRFA